MAGYNSRQSSYSDGDVITAAHTNDEFNALVAAFNAATGHAHDGTAGEGPVIAVIGDAGSGTPLNKVEIDTANDRIGFFVDVSSSSVEQVRLYDGVFGPVTNNDVDLGTTSVRFKDAYFGSISDQTGYYALGGRIYFNDTGSSGDYLGYATQEGLSYYENGTLNWTLAGSNSPTYPSFIGANPGSGSHFGLGTTTPKYRLDILDYTTENVMRIVGSTGANISFGDQLDPVIWKAGVNVNGNFTLVEDATSQSPFVVQAGASSNTLVASTSGRVGIGTSSPTTNLDVIGSIRVSGGNIFFDSTLTSGDYLNWTTTQGFRGYENGTAIFYMSSTSSAAGFHTNDFYFGALNTNNLTTGTLDGVFIDADGQVNVSGNAQSSLALRRRTSDGAIAIFRRDTTQVGSISVTTTATSYNTSSDERLKENIVDCECDSGAAVDGIRVREFDWKINGEHQDYGFIAQELEVYAPYAVTTDDSPEGMKSVDYSKLVPLMMKELQELRKRVAELESGV